MELTAERLREVADYIPETGELVWAKSKQRKDLIGKRLGNLHKTNDRYSALRGCVDGKYYMVHKLVWLYVTGELPDKEIDHINHNPADNRFENLRLVCRADNNRNASRRKDNSSGFTGVYWDKNKWQVIISTDGKPIGIGRYADFEEAVSARLFAQDYYGYHENHGVVA